jgi:glycosyltransferase involved in cell wall biosynthesis
VKEEWIESKINSICERKGSRVSVKWICGAHGEEKAELFRNAQIFVFPSTFPVEAQPLVLLEAMASGCALITSTVGEIPSTVDESVAILEENPTAEVLAQDIRKLLESPAERVRLGLGGVARMREKYSVSVHIDNWERVIRDIL